MLLDVDYFSPQYSEEASQDIEKCEKVEKLGAVNGSLRFVLKILHLLRVKNTLNFKTFRPFLCEFSLSVSLCSDETLQALREWKKHDDESERFCMLDGSLLV